MKTCALPILIILACEVESFSQNGITAWDSNKITSIEIEHQNSTHEKEIYTFESEQDGEKIIEFFANIEFNELDQLCTKNLGDDSIWKYEIVFQGLRDGVFIFDNHAYIGKTRFSIDKKVHSNFKEFLEKLKSKSKHQVIR